MSAVNLSPVIRDWLQAGIAEIHPVLTPCLPSNFRLRFVRIGAKRVAARIRVIKTEEAAC